ncbi:MAG: tetratricopeptide repeat protein, partial [Planctomycetota bacterium]
MRIATATIVATLVACLGGTPTHAAPPVMGARQAPPATSQTQLRLPSLGGWLGWRGNATRQPGPAAYSAHQPPTPAWRSASVAPPPHTHGPAATARVAGAYAGRPGQLPPATAAAQTPLAESCMQLAKVAEQAGDIAGAREQLQQALAAEPANMRLLRRYGRLEDRQGRLGEAEKLYRQAVMVNPADAAALNDLALCYARQNKLQESVATLSQAIAQQPDRKLYRNNIAKVLVQLGDIRSASEQLTAVHGPVIASYNVGRLLAAAGNQQQAVAALRHAATLDPSFTPAMGALAQLSPMVPAPAAGADAMPQLANRPSPSGLRVAAPSAEQRPRADAQPAGIGAAPASAG